MKQLVIQMIFDEATTGPDIARLLREAGEHVERAWPGALPGPATGTTVMALRDANKQLVGTATFGEAKIGDKP